MEFKFTAKLCFCILCLWLVLSTFPQMVHMFLCFYFSEDVPVDMALDLRSNPVVSPL